MSKVTYVEGFGQYETSIYDMETTRKYYNDGKVVMRYSPLDAGWSPHVRGQVAAKLKDNGNGVKIKFDDGTKIKLDYSQVQELYILLDYYNYDSELTNMGPTITKMETSVCKCTKEK